MPDADADKINWKVHTELRKWSEEADHQAGAEPDSIDLFEDNLLLNVGITRLLNLLVGAGATKAFDAAHSRIGVGDSSTAAAAGQTDLQAPVNKLYHRVDSAPVVVGQTVTFVATFTAGEANFAWSEWGIDNGTATDSIPVPPLLNRKVQDMGTKAGSALWVFTVTVTLS